MPYVLLAAMLVAVSLAKHLTLQYAGIRERATPIGATVFIGAWMLAAGVALMLLFPSFRAAVMADFSEGAAIVPLAVTLFKGVLVGLIVSGKQRLLAGRRTNAYALVAFLGLGPLGFVNGLMGEDLGAWQYISVMGLALYGLVFLFIDDMAKAGWGDRLAFLFVIAVSTTPAMTDHFAKSHGIAWQTSWVVSNAGLLAFAALASLKVEGAAGLRRAFGATLRDRAVLLAAAAWILSEAVILWVSFTQLDVTVSETTRNLYIPVLMGISAVMFAEPAERKKRLVRAVLLGAVAYLLALPMMLQS